jgi:aspartyl-tRNA(Asn)/glutamyl-tRNA(Gln) amidotransferase subunit A
MRLAVPTTIVLDELEDAVARTFERALETLARQGALIERIAVPEFLDVGVMNAKGGFTAAESYAWHRYLIASKGDVYDPRVVAAHPARRSHQCGGLYRSDRARGGR